MRALLDWNLLRGRPKTAEQISECGRGKCSSLLKLKPFAHPDAVKYQRQYNTSSGYAQVDVPVFGPFLQLFLTITVLSS